MKSSTQMRNQDLLAVARQTLAIAMSRGQVLTIKALLEATLARQPRMHYVDFDTASAKLHDIDRRGIDKAVRNPLARQQWAELHSQVAEAMATRRRLNFVQALTFVLHFRRPSRFYISTNAAFKILRRHFRPGLIEVRV